MQEKPSRFCDPQDAAAVSKGLITHLRAHLGDASVTFAEQPTRILGGNQTWVYGFRLAAPGGTWGSPLILRILRGSVDPETVRAESILHRVLLEQGFPVPEVLDFNLAPEQLGGPFQIMTRVRGAPLLHGFDDPEERQGEGLFLQHLRAGLGNALFGPWPRLLAETHARLHALDAEPLVARLRDAGSDPGWFGLERRLAQVETRIEQHDLDGLRPALDWLRKSQPRPETPLSICHGDLFPNQVLSEGGEVTGVIDWSRAVLAPAAVDVGLVSVGMDCVVLELPAPLSPMAEAVHRRVASGFVRRYRRLRPLEPELFRFGGALRCVEMLIEVSILRLARSGRFDGDPGPNPYDSKRGVDRLLRYLRRVMGIAARPASEAGG